MAGDGAILDGGRTFPDRDCILDLTKPIALQARMGGKETQTVVAALTAQVQHLPRELRQRLT